VRSTSNHSHGLPQQHSSTFQQQPKQTSSGLAQFISNQARHTLGDVNANDTSRYRDHQAILNKSIQSGNNLKKVVPHPMLRPQIMQQES
jgi:hypothetical protein